MSIIRTPKTLTGTLNTTIGTTPNFYMGTISGSIIFIPDLSPITTLTFYVSDQQGAVYLPLLNAAGEAVTMTVVAGNAYPLPDECFAAWNMKIVANAAGAVTITGKC